MWKGYRCATHTLVFTIFLDFGELTDSTERMVILLGFRYLSLVELRRFAH